ncbi:MAG: TatD family hydrolase [Defluviitaleaceae bacterium]|nr:TatD family hydrolase [Defluviitaleaceae bacterium]
MYFETHSHYDFDHYDNDRDQLLGEILPEAGIDYILNIGTSMKTSRTTLELAQKYDYIYAALGFHPHNAKDLRYRDLEIIAKMADEPKVVAIGEIGLDYHYDHSPRDVQREQFEAQLDLALNLGLPVVIHCREAAEDTMKILTASGAGAKIGGVMHCFSSGVVEAQKYLDMGWHIGVGGVVTYKNAPALREVVEITPRNRLLIETDCPYLSPDPNRGQRNDSRNLVYIAEKIASIWGTTAEEVAKITTQNAKELFSIK